MAKKSMMTKKTKIKASPKRISNNNIIIVIGLETHHEKTCFGQVNSLVKLIGKITDYTKLHM